MPKIFLNVRVRLKVKLQVLGQQHRQKPYFDFHILSANSVCVQYVYTNVDLGSRNKLLVAIFSSIVLQPLTIVTKFLAKCGMVLGYIFGFIYLLITFYVNDVIT